MRRRSSSVVLAARAKAAGLSLEVEKGGLRRTWCTVLRTAPAVGTAGGGQQISVGAFLGLYGPAAFDLAVTCGLQQGHAAVAAADGGRAAADYEGRKNQHLHTLTTCAAEGFQFLPLVAEACSGGWGPSAMKSWKEFATGITARSGESVAVERLLQSLAAALQRENGRAVLRRLAE